MYNMHYACLILRECTWLSVWGERWGGEKGLGIVDLSNYNIAGLQYHQRYFSLSSTAQLAGGI